MKPNYGSVVSFCTSSIQSAASDRRLRSGYCSKTCSFGSNIYKSESERPSVQKVVAEGTRIDRLYLGKFIPLRERKLLQKLIATRAVYDDAINLSMSVCEVKAPRQSHPCQCNFDDCESLMKLMSRTRMQKFKQSKSRLQRRLSKGLKKSLNKMKVSKQKYINMEDWACEPVCDPDVCTPTKCLTKISKRRNKTVGHKYSKHGAGPAKSVTTFSSSTDSMTQTRKKRSDEKIETRKEKIHHRHNAAGAIKPKVNVNIGSKKKKQLTKKEGISQQRNINKSQTRSSIKSASTTSSGYKKESKMVGDNKRKNLKSKKSIPRKIISKGSMTSYSPAKLQKESTTKTETTKHKEHKIQTNADRALKRCFCTLKIKAKRKLSKQVSQESMTLRIPAGRKPQVREKASVTDNKEYKAKQASKESMTSRSSGMYKQQVREQSSLTEKRVNQDQEALLPSSCECLKLTKKHPKLSSTESRKTRSAFSLTPKYVTPTKAKRVQSSIVTRKSSISKSKTRSNVKRVPREIQSSRSVSYRNRLLEVCIESPKDDRIQSVPQTAPKSKPRKKIHRVKLAKEYGSQGDNRFQKSIALEHERKEVGSALKRCFCTLKFHNAYKDKHKVVSSSYREKKHRPQTDAMPHKIKQLATSSRPMKGRYSRRAVKISSSFCFDINLCRDVPPVAHKKLIQNNVKTKNTEPTRSLSSHESQTEIAKKTDNAALVKPMVKRCFCTLQLYEKQQQEIAKRERSKIYNVNRLTVANVKPLSPKIRNTVLMKNESYPFASESDLKINLNALNKEISTLQLKKSKNVVSTKPTFQVVRLSSDLSFKLTHTCKPHIHPRETIPFSKRFFYAMNVEHVYRNKSELKNPTTGIPFECDTCDYQVPNIGKSKTSTSLYEDIASKSASSVAHMLENKHKRDDKTHTNYPKRCTLKQGVPCHRKLSHFHRQVGHTKSTCSSNIDYLKILTNKQHIPKTRPNEQNVKYQSDNVHMPSTFHPIRDQNKQYKDSKFNAKNANALVVNEAIIVAAKPKRNIGKEKYVSILPKRHVPKTPKNHIHVRDKMKQLTRNHPVLNQYDCTPSLFYDSIQCTKKKHKRTCHRGPCTEITDVPTEVRTDNIPPKIRKQSPGTESHLLRAIRKLYACTQHNGKTNDVECPQTKNIFENNIKNNMIFQQPIVLNNVYKTKQCKANAITDDALETKRNVLYNNHLKRIRIRDSQIITKKIKSTVSAINPFFEQCFNILKMQAANNTVISDTKDRPGKRVLPAKEDYNRAYVCNKTESKKQKSFLNIASNKNSCSKKSNQFISCETKKRTKRSNKSNKVLKQQDNKLQRNKAEIKTNSDWRAKPYVFDPYVYLLEKCDPYNKELLKNASLHTTTYYVRSTEQLSANETLGRIRNASSAMNENEKNYKMNALNINSPPLSCNKIKKSKHITNSKRTKVPPVTNNVSHHSRPSKSVLYAKSVSKTYSASYKPYCREVREISNIKSQENKTNISNILKRCFNTFKIQRDKSPMNKRVNASNHQGFDVSRIRKPNTEVSAERIAGQSRKKYMSSHNLRQTLRLPGQHNKLDSQKKKHRIKTGNNEKSIRNHEVLTILPYTPNKLKNIFSKTRFISNKNYTWDRKTIKEDKNKINTNVAVETIIHSRQRYPDTSIKTMFRCITQFFRKSNSHDNLNIKLTDKPKESPISCNKAKKNVLITGGSLKVSKSDRPVTNHKTTALHKKSRSVNSSKIPGKNTHYKKHRLLIDHKVKRYSRFQSGDTGITEMKPTICHKKPYITSHSNNQITCMYCRAQYDNKPIESIKINYLDGSNPTRDITGARKVKDIKVQKLMLLPACVKECNPKICATHMTRPCPCISPKIPTNVKKPKRKDCCCLDPTPYCGPLELTEEERRLSRKQVPKDYEPPASELPSRPLPARGRRHKVGGDASIAEPSVGGKGRLSTVSGRTQVSKIGDGTGQTGLDEVGVIQPGGGDIGEQGQTAGGGAELAQTDGGKGKLSKRKGKTAGKSGGGEGIVIQPVGGTGGVVQPGGVTGGVIQPGGIGGVGQTADGTVDVGKAKGKKKKGKKANDVTAEDAGAAYVTAAQATGGVIQPGGVTGGVIQSGGIGGVGQTADETLDVGKAKGKKKKGKKANDVTAEDAGAAYVTAAQATGGVIQPGGVTGGVIQPGGIGGVGQTADGTLDVGKAKGKKKKGKKANDVTAEDAGAAYVTAAQATGGVIQPGSVTGGVIQPGGIGGAGQTADGTVDVGKVKGKKKKGKKAKDVTAEGAGAANVTVEQATGLTATGPTYTGVIGKDTIKGRKVKNVNIVSKPGVQGPGVTNIGVTGTGTQNIDDEDNKKKTKANKGKDKVGEIAEVITDAVCACKEEEDKLSKNPIKNYITCLRHLNKPPPPPPPPPPPEPVEYMDPEPLFEMKLMADTMDLINPHDVMFKVQQLRSSLKYHPEELLKRLQKIHGLACRCCICVAVEQAALKKQQSLQRKGKKKKKKKMSDKERKKNLEEKLALLNRNPCICGSKKCQQVLNDICTNELKLQELKKKVPCVCGTKICAQERMKEDVRRKLITKESMKQNIREKERQKREMKQKMDFETRQARYKKEDKLRRKKRKKIDKQVTKQVKKQVQTTPDLVLACESLVDVGKLGVVSVFKVLRSIFKKAIHPVDTYKTLRYTYKEPRRWKSILSDVWVDSGIKSVAKRIFLRLTGMKKTQQIKQKVDSSPTAGYVVHVFDPDEKRRLKYLKKHTAMKRKALRKREPMDYECSLFMASQRRRPYLSIYYMCPWFYPHCVSLINLWRQCTDVLLFLLAVIVWSPCILCMELFRGLMCCTVCTA